jgi:hypothetical protein
MMASFNVIGHENRDRFVASLPDGCEWIGGESIDVIVVHFPMPDSESHNEAINLFVQKHEEIMYLSI